MITIIGAGRSSVYLLEYLVKYSETTNRKMTVLDREMTVAMLDVQNYTHVEVQVVNLSNKELIGNLVQNSEIVVSMLPAALHMEIAYLCLKHSVHFASASYISEEMKSLHDEVKQKGLIFLNEMGLDPGIDHMSAMAIMDEVRQKGAEIKGFESYCGGLVADEDEGENPWKYKFTWNPANVVKAAQGPPAAFKSDEQLKLIPYHRIFSEIKSFTLSDGSKYDAYANRDSLAYISLYGLENCSDILRGTFRKEGFCEAWNVLVQAGATDSSLKLKWDSETRIGQWFAMFFDSGKLSTKEFLAREWKLSKEVIQKLDWIGLFSDEPLPLTEGTCAQVLEEILKPKWLLLDTDHDMVVMLHRIRYQFSGKSFLHLSEMKLKGESSLKTAMAKTVGLPLAMGVELILEKKIQNKGVLAPVHPEVYVPVLEKLKNFGIEFKDRVDELSA